MHLALEPVGVAGLPRQCPGGCGVPVAGREGVALGVPLVSLGFALLPVPSWTRKVLQAPGRPTAWVKDGLKTLLQKLPPVQRQGQEALGLRRDQHDNAGPSLF